MCKVMWLCLHASEYMCVNICVYNINLHLKLIEDSSQNLNSGIGYEGFFSIWIHISLIICIMSACVAVLLKKKVILVYLLKNK